MPWNTEQCCDKAVWSLSFLQSRLLQLLQFGFLMENLLMVWPTYCSCSIIQVTVQVPQFAHARFWFSGKFLLFVFICEKHGTMDLLYFLWQPQVAQPLQGLGIPLICFCMLLKARHLLSISFCLIVVDRQ